MLWCNLFSTNSSALNHFHWQPNSEMESIITKSNKIQPVWLIHISSMFFFSQVSSFKDEKQGTSIAIKEPPLDWEESKLNSTIIVNSSIHTIIDDKLIKRPFNKNKVATVKIK